MKAISFKTVRAVAVLSAGLIITPTLAGEGTVYPLKIDGQSGGRVFDGVGGVSAGGSSRLLVDYPEPERGEILDYLFKPNFGAALQILKVEIGADTDATAGAEPSHMRAPNEIDSERGYEWWLMKEARARNPDIKLCALAWGAAGWLQGGFWSDDNIQYTLAWLDCARNHGLKIDYLGGGNERGWDAGYYVKLAQALKIHGYTDIKVVATDDHHPPDYWAVTAEMKTNPAFAEAVDVIGQHDVCVWRTPQRHCHVSEDALLLGKPLWDSENSTQDYRVGLEPLARVMNRHYIDARITGNMNWALLGAYYGNFPAPGTGLILADRPWSGYYDVGRIVWVDAHTTQFTAPGWRYLDSACGYTPCGASYVALCSPDGGDYTVVIETMDLTRPEDIELTVTGGLSNGKVHLWSSNLRSDSEKDQFQHLRTLRPEAGARRVTLQPGRIYTLSTTTGQKKGRSRTKAPRDQRLALPFQEDFEDTGANRLAAFFADVHGAFEAAPCAGARTGKCYRQVVTQEPILWHKAKMPPTTVVGDPSWWGDYEVGVDALLEEPGYVELLGRVESQLHRLNGYHFQVADTGAWKLYADELHLKGRLLASGTNSPFGLNVWHRLTLRFVADHVTALLDGFELAAVSDKTHTTGQVGMRVSSWQQAQFDDLRVTRTAPWPQFIPYAAVEARATSEHAENDFGSVHIAANAIDDRLETTWRSEYAPPAPLPQSITLDLKGKRAVQALVYKPAVDRLDGAITRYAIYTSTDGRIFEKVASGVWQPNNAAKVASWTKKRVRFVRLEAIETAGDSRKGVEVAEIKISATPISGFERN